MRFPAWYLGKNPEHHFLAVSYNSTLAGRFGRKARNLIDSRDYRALFPDVQLAADSKAADVWNTSQAGGYACGGVGYGSGMDADVLLIDDPIKNREEADSAVVRETFREWYTSTGRPRLMPGGVIVLTMTLYHEDDPGGWLTQQMLEGGEEWEVVKMPALIESDEDERVDALHRKRGEALWPAWYDRDALLEIKRTIGTRDWSALYQCRPIPEGGEYFQRDWFPLYTELPKLRKYITSDFAVGESEQNDFTVHLVWGCNDAGDLYLVDRWKERRLSDESIDAAFDMIAEHGPMCWVNEKGVIMKALGPSIRKRMQERRIFCRMEDYARTADKVAMARSFQARASMRRVHLPASAPWLGEFIRSLTSFPAGAHDDDVDACALIGLHLDRVTKPLPKHPRGMPRMNLAIDPLRG